jgi:predicted PurR-regulated permease PerM
MDEIPKTHSPNIDASNKNGRDQWLLNFKFEEYKYISEQSKFVMTRYMQAGALYLALSGFVIKEIVSTPNVVLAYLVAFFFFSINILFYLAARKFRDMAYHWLNKQKDIADDFGFHRPYSMMWGYNIGVACVCLVIGAIVAVVLFRACWPKC